MFYTTNTPSSNLYTLRHPSHTLQQHIFTLIRGQRSVCGPVYRVEESKKTLSRARERKRWQPTGWGLTPPCVPGRLAAEVPFSGGICSKTPTTQSCAAVTIQRVDIWYGMMTLQTYSYELCGDTQHHPLVAFNTTQVSS